MQRKSIVVALLLIPVAVLATGCRDELEPPSSPAPPSSPESVDPAAPVTHSYSTDEPGDEYWTPERMESAVPEMPTQD